MKKSNKDKLDKLREEINQIDHDLILILNNRMKIVEKISSIKSEIDYPIFNPFRESEILERLLEYNLKHGKYIPQDELIRLYKTIFKISKTLQGCIKFFYLGNSLKNDIYNKIKSIFDEKTLEIIQIDDVRDYFNNHETVINNFLIVKSEDLLSYLFKNLNNDNVIKDYRIIITLNLDEKYYIIGFMKNDSILNTNIKVNPIYFNYIQDMIEYKTKFEKVIFNILSRKKIKYSLKISKNVLIIEFIESLPANNVANIKKELSFNKFNMKILGYCPKYYYFL